MARALTTMAMVVAMFLLLLFGLDLAIKFPFGRASLVMDIIFVLCSIGLGYASWNTMKDLK